MNTLTERTPLHVPDLHLFEENGLTFAVDPTAPNWIALEERGERQSLAGCSSACH